ncbi:HipA domain-containing protein [Pseudomonas cichorii]|nr:HipA domain-containing protein [Pseudomonas cichorii]MBX8492414.1 HipA domain-containing protein [Pseudomonas cichorii]MBX8522839.1 HipA domain-containing protein [Pseudomonas cichorii]MBX8552070.1 HipA domain-containing protein [Pseudomonas cichorii]MBX8586939.1 HipA domain-containing protein [Pseudomonas cichorii]
MHNLTLQIYTNGQWRDAMRLCFEQPDEGLTGVCAYGYEQSYLIDSLEVMGDRLSKAVSAVHPLGWDSWRDKKAPAFLFDILPSGAARRSLLKRLHGERPADLSLDLFLLGRCTPAPIGNLRIKESVEAIAGNPVVGFTRDEVVSRDSRFLEYAYEQGAAIGGATGAGGEAPKLLLVESRDGALHPDAVLPDAEAARHWFVKFARNKAEQTDQDILRSEYCFYRAIQQLGMDTVAAEGLALEEGHKPSLWMHRFDREISSAGVGRTAVESMYSLCGVAEAGSYMQHPQVLRNLVALWQDVGQDKQVGDLVFEYMRRDLLNQILGNSDNHGRNTSILRTGQGVQLAPIYDLAPMVMDGEGITRTTKWPKHIELAGEVNWRSACAEAAEWVDADELFQRLRAAAQELLALPDLLNADGLPTVTMNHPRIALRNLQQQFVRWGLM